MLYFSGFAAWIVGDCDTVIETQTSDDFAVIFSTLGDHETIK
jgi:hypothetical protein